MNGYIYQLCVHIISFFIEFFFLTKAFPISYLLQYEYYCDHVYSPKDDSVTWTLDYEKLSDFDDVAGHWHLEDHPTKPGCTRVFYACDIKFKRAVPGPVMNFLTKSALKQATSWVKRESEGKPEASIPKQYAIAFVASRRSKL